MRLRRRDLTTCNATGTSGAARRASALRRWRHPLTSVAVAVLLGPADGALADVSAKKSQVDGSTSAQLWAKGSGGPDGDGKADLVVGAAGGGIFWYRNGAWLPKLTIDPMLKPAEETRVADLTNDGAKDIIVAIPGGSVWFENSDGRIDLLVTPPHPTISRTHKVAWYEAPADRTATWTQHVLENDAQPGTHTAWVVDLGGDGRNDLVTALDSLGASPLPIKVHINRGDETFTVQTIANDAQHAMQVLTVGGKKALVGADYNETPDSSIDMWLLTPTQAVGAGITK
jgi:hypothetical protein